MKNFYNEREPYNESWSAQEYKDHKREKVIEVIKPICDAFGIRNYDYIVDVKKGIERLVLEGQQIMCMENSIGATVEELVGYIFVKMYMPEKYWSFKPQTRAYIKQYWVEGE